jgi:uncharacterized protein (TIGR02145 family)
VVRIIGGETTILIGGNTTWLGFATGGTWRSSNTSVATVSNDGVVTGITGGTAIITYTNSIGSATRAITVVMNVDGCAATILPGFTAEFLNTTQTTVGGLIWSAPVIASHCRKTTYNGGVSGAYASDCRSNNATNAAVHASNGRGDLFSWCMVARFGDRLCPAPWRVPTTEEFRDLNLALISTSPAVADITFPSAGDSYTSVDVRNRFVGTGIGWWRTVYAGHSDVTSDGNIGLVGVTSATTTGTTSNFWSRSEIDTDHARGHFFNSTGLITPQASSNKALGFSLRCVRDTVTIIGGVTTIFAGDNTSWLG